MTIDGGGGGLLLVEVVCRAYFSRVAEFLMHNLK